jgi:hypothetical protein
MAHPAVPDFFAFAASAPALIPNSEVESEILA